MAEQDGAIVGVLPLVHVKSRLFGNTLISTPFCVYGGPLALDRETAAALENAGCSLMRRTGARAVEFRYLDDADTRLGRRGRICTSRSASRSPATPTPT